MFNNLGEMKVRQAFLSVTVSVGPLKAIHTTYDLGTVLILVSRKGARQLRCLSEEEDSGFRCFTPMSRLAFTYCAAVEEEDTKRVMGSTSLVAN